MIERSRKAVGAALSLALAVQAGCGTIMYPQRRGQRGGRVDAGVAVLDGIGLLFFIIPGVIAFAVDFGDGAIYLPGGGPGPLSLNGLKRVRFDPRRVGPGEIERLVEENTGVALKLGGRDVEVFELSSKDEMLARFASARNERVVATR